MRTKWRGNVSLYCLLLVAQVSTVAAQPQTGPTVPSFGPVLAPPPGSFNLNPETHYKVSIDVGETAEFP